VFLLCQMLHDLSERLYVRQLGILPCFGSWERQAPAWHSSSHWPCRARARRSQAFDRSDAVGIAAGSRWLSEDRATPPDNVMREFRIPIGMPAGHVWVRSPHLRIGNGDAKNSCRQSSRNEHEINWYIP